MANVKIKDVDVIITADAAAPNGVRFALDEHNGSGPGQQVSFHNSRHPGIIVHFNIDDPGGTGLLFQAAPGNAIRIDKPAGGTHLVPLSVEQGGTQLIAYCRNENAGQFKFTLRFQGPGGPIDYDPIGDGQNGPRL